MKKIMKKESLRKWIESNPGKTGRDSLLEERCMNEIQCVDLKRLFDWADMNNRIIKVCPTVGLFKDPNSLYHQSVRNNNSRRAKLRDRILGENSHLIYPIICIEADFQVVGTYKSLL